MSHRIAAKITGVAGYVPPKVLTNADLERMVETNDEWIRTRTGIRERHIAENGTASSHLATEAAKTLLEKTKTDPSEIDLIIVASVTPDMFFPATACLVQDRLGAKRAWGFDLSAACSGFAYALTVGAQFVGSGAHRKVLVIGSDVMSSILDYNIVPPAFFLATARERCCWSLQRTAKAFWIFRTMSTVPVDSICTCPGEARCIPPPTRPSTKTCTSCIKRARKSSSMPCGAWPNLPRACWSATDLRPMTWRWWYRIRLTCGLFAPCSSASAWKIPKSW